MQIIRCACKNYIVGKNRFFCRQNWKHSIATADGMYIYSWRSKRWI